MKTESVCEPEDLIYKPEVKTSMPTDRYTSEI